MDRAKLLHHQPMFRGQVVDLAVDRIELPNGSETDLEIIRHPGAAAVVAIDAQRHVLLVRQYRYATDGWLLEVPAGKLDPDEPPERCAARELAEETGFAPGALQSLGWIWTTPGFTDEKIWLFLATQLQPGEQRLQQDEVLTVESIPLEQAVDRASRGEIVDGKSVCALLRAQSWLERVAG